MPTPATPEHTQARFAPGTQLQSPEQEHGRGRRVVTPADVVTQTHNDARVPQRGAEWHARVGARLEDVVPDPAQIVEVAPVRVRQPTGFTGGRTGHLGLTKLRALPKGRDHPCEVLLPQDGEEEHLAS